MGGYLQTILTYSIPSEAEVDKAFLESEGFTVNLLNANMSRNEWGDAFFIRLQVPAEEASRARQTLWEVNPKRFGNAETVEALDRQIKRMAIVFIAVAIVVGALCLLFMPDFGHRWFPLHARRGRTDWHISTALIVAIAAGAIAAALDSRHQRGKSRT